MRGSCGLRPPEYGVGVRRAPRDRGHLPEGGISGLSTCHVLPPPECPQMSFGVKSMCVPESGGARVQKKPRQPRRAGQGKGEVPGQSRWVAVERPQGRSRRAPAQRPSTGAKHSWPPWRGPMECHERSLGEGMACRGPGKWGSPRNPPGAMPVSLGTPGMGAADGLASVLAQPQGHSGRGSGGGGRFQDQCKAQSHPPHHPRGWFKAASQSEAGRWGKKKA